MSKQILLTIAALAAQARAADGAINSAGRTPNGDDYNALFALVEQMAAALPAVVTLTRTRIEVGAPRNGKPGYRWATGYIVNGEYPPVLRPEAYNRAREIGGTDAIIIEKDA